MVSLDVGPSAVHVWGIFQSIAPLLPFLKEQKFRYDSTSQVWSRDLAGWEGLGELERKVDALNGPALARAEDRSKAVRALLSEALAGPWCGFSFQTHDATSVLLVGRIDRLRTFALAAGGKGREQAIRFETDTLDATGFRRLLDSCKALADEYRERIAVVDQIAPPATTRAWRYLGATLFNSPNPRRVEIRAPDEFAATLQGLGATYRPNLRRWTLKAISVKADAWRRLVAQLDEAEAAAEKAAGPGAVPSGAGTGRQVNRTTETCAGCGLPVAPGEGFVSRLTDPETEETFKQVRHMQCGGG